MLSWHNSFALKNRKTSALIEYYQRPFRNFKICLAVYVNSQGKVKISLGQKVKTAIM